MTEPAKVPKKKIHYVNNKDLYAAMVEYKKSVNEAKEAGNRVEVVSVFNLDNVPSVVPDIKNVGKKNR